MTELEILKKRVEELEEFKELVSMFFRSIFSRVDSECFYYGNAQETILWALEHAFEDLYYHKNCKEVFKIPEEDSDKSDNSQEEQIQEISNKTEPEKLIVIPDSELSEEAKKMISSLNISANKDQR